MVCGSLAFKSKQICWQLPDLFIFFPDALNQWLKVNWAWANGVLKCTCLGLPVSGFGSVSLFWYEGRFVWEGGRNGKINTVMTTGVWEASVTLWHPCQFCSEGGECPCTCAAITLPSLSCIQKSFKSDYLPVLEMWKMRSLPAAVEVVERIRVSWGFTSHSSCSFTLEVPMCCS